MACFPLGDVEAKIAKPYQITKLPQRGKAALRLLSLGVPTEEVADQVGYRVEWLRCIMCSPVGRAYLAEQEALNREATARLFAERAWAAIYGKPTKGAKRKGARKAGSKAKPKRTK